jgi:YidC/Oxa1 family membrane protein insertase
MEQNNNSGSQSRFLTAAALSMAVLLSWQYFFSPQRPAEDPNAANTAANVTQQATPQPAAEAPKIDPATVTPDTTPARTIKIRSPFYEVTLDSKGAVATSWIILKNRSPKSEFDVYADGSSAGNEKPLQLISDEALKSDPREVPFRLSTGDAALNSILNGRNYAISAEEGEVTLAEGEERVIDFTLTDPSGIEVKKTFVFRGEGFISDLGITAKRNGETIRDMSLLIGASIGDHAINNHNFYHIESEAVAAINGDIVRHQGYYAFTFDAEGRSRLSNTGTVDWAGVGDAYFAMAAIPATPSQGVEYRASKYEVQTEPFFSSIFQWILRSTQTSEVRHLVTVYLPISADGSLTKIYTGTKDYFLLAQLSENSATQLGRQVEITNLINFSNYWWLRWITKPLSIPILYALNFFNALVHNYGLAIIIFTFLFYMLLFPLRWSQTRSFKKASGNAPKMKAIQDKIKDLQKKGVPNDDPRMRELQMQQLKMTKDALPIGGCLPMLLQFPLLIAFYTAVTVSLEVRQSSFLWLPDLSAADPWHILEFAFALSMVLAMKFTPQPSAALSDEQRMQQQMQQRMMTYFMPLMMLWVMWAAPSGLLLYWFCGNIVSFGQQMVINKMHAAPPPAAGTEIVQEVPKGAKKVKQKRSKV